MVRRRIAVLGGGRAVMHGALAARRPGLSVRLYRSPNDGGRGETRRLIASLRAGGVDGVVIVRRFNGHSASETVRAVCERLDVPCCIIDRPAELPAALHALA